MADGFLRIGEVAQRADLSLRTVRYYEEQGLVVPAKRTQGGFRLYTDEQVARLLLIKQMKPLDFSVEQMRELLEARDALAAGDACEPEVRRAAVDTVAAYADDVEARIAKLREKLSNAEAFAADLAREAAAER